MGRAVVEHLQISWIWWKSWALEISSNVPFCRCVGSAVHGVVVWRGTSPRGSGHPISNTSFLDNWKIWPSIPWPCKGLTNSALLCAEKLKRPMLSHGYLTLTIMSKKVPACTLVVSCLSCNTSNPKLPKPGPEWRRGWLKRWRWLKLPLSLLKE